MKNNEIRVGDRVKFKSWAEIVKIVLIDKPPRFLNQVMYVLQNVQPFCNTWATVEMIGESFSGQKTFLLSDFSLKSPPFTKAEFLAEFTTKVEVEDA